MTSALGGKKGAMGCTMAVEELIGSHYNEQVNQMRETKRRGNDYRLRN